MKRFFTLILLLPLITACTATDTNTNTNTDTPPSSDTTPPQNEIPTIEQLDPLDSISDQKLEAPKNPETGDNSTTQTINELSSLDDLKGKASVILFGGTFCSHCRAAMPEYKAKIWDNYKDKANLWVNVVDGQKGAKFNAPEIAQGYNRNFDYTDITKESCEYVPSWVVLDSEGNVKAKRCGGGDMGEIEKALSNLI